MARSEKRVCWDACAWIALIQDEKIMDDAGKLIENRGQMSRGVFDLAKKGKIEIVTSGLSLAEVCKNRLVKEGAPTRVAEVFEHEFVLLAPLDRQIGEKARELMMVGIYFGLKPQDACHLATAAIVPGVSELHTFDKKLLDLNLKIERIDQTMLKICKPHTDAGMDPPLLGAMRDDQNGG